MIITNHSMRNHFSSDY